MRGGPTVARARGGQRPGGQDADPGLRRAAERRDPAGPGRARARRARAHGRLRPGGARRRDDDRHGLPRPARHRPARVPVERRHRDRRRAVLLPPELDLAPRRPGGGRRDVAGGLRDGARALGRRFPRTTVPRSTSTASPSGRWASRACSRPSTSSTSRSTARSWSARPSSTPCTAGWSRAGTRAARHPCRCTRTVGPCGSPTSEGGVERGPAVGADPARVPPARLRPGRLLLHRPRVRRARVARGRPARHRRLPGDGVGPGR